MPTAGLYARLSLVREGQEGLAVERQLQDCRAKAETLGWTVAEEYVDEDLSASKNVVRPSYERLLADLESGRIDAVVVYALERLTRRPAELEEFIDLADRKSVKLANVSGDVDLTTSSGRMVARILGSVAKQESERTGERVSRQRQQRAESGKGPGSRYRTFGYTRSFEIVDDEAVVVRDMFTRAAAGESLQSITNSLNSTKVTTTAGKEWRRTAVANLLRRPGYCGRATLKGEVVGATEYPAIISEELWQAAQRDPRGAGFNARVHLLSGIAVCGICHSPMYGTTSGRYACKPDRPGSCGRVTIKAQWLDLAVLVSLVMPATREAMESTAPSGAVDHSAEIAAVDQRIDDLRLAHDRQELELADLLPMLRAERDKRAVLVREQAATVVNSTMEQLASKSFLEIAGAPLSQRRALIRRYWTAIIVKPTTAPGRRRFDPERVDVLWVDGHVSKLPTSVAGPSGMEALGVIFGAAGFEALGTTGD